MMHVKMKICAFQIWDCASRILTVAQGVSNLLQVINVSLAGVFACFV